MVYIIKKENNKDNDKEEKDLEKRKRQAYMRLLRNRKRTINKPFSFNAK